MITTGNDLIPVEIIVEPFEEMGLELELYKSLQFMKDRFEFIEKDADGLKMRVRSKFLAGEFLYEVGYVVVSDYDDRKYLVTKIDPQNYFMWFGSWE